MAEALARGAVDLVHKAVVFGDGSAATSARWQYTVLETVPVATQAR